MYRGERFNAYSHLAGTLLAITGLAILLLRDSVLSDVWKIVSFSVYGGFLILLYLISTIYHSTKGRTKDFFQKLDHLAIYLLIAGSYTPFTLVTLRGPWGWTLFGVVWGLALFGFIQEIWFSTEKRYLSLFIYLLMGWSVVVAIKPLVMALATPGLVLLVGGGVAYTGGVYFFINDEKFKHFHGIWHLFVLLGSVLHFCAILLYVV